MWGAGGVLLVVEGPCFTATDVDLPGDGFSPKGGGLDVNPATGPWDVPGPRISRSKDLAAELVRSPACLFDRREVDVPDGCVARVVHDGDVFFLRLGAMDGQKGKEGNKHRSGGIFKEHDRTPLNVLRNAKNTTIMLQIKVALSWKYSYFVIATNLKCCWLYLASLVA